MYWIEGNVERRSLVRSKLSRRKNKPANQRRISGMKWPTKRKLIRSPAQTQLSRLKKKERNNDDDDKRLFCFKANNGRGFWPVRLRLLGLNAVAVCKPQPVSRLHTSDQSTTERVRNTKPIDDTITTARQPRCQAFSLILFHFIFRVLLNSLSE